MFEHGWLINLIRDRECPHCHGTGLITQGTLRPYACDDCNGTGIASHPTWRAVAAWILIIGSIASIAIPLWLWLR